MKIFAIRNKNNIFGCLFSSADYRDYYIEINDEVSPQTVFFKLFIEKGRLVINSDWSKRYIEERAIPSNRQNIADIMKSCQMDYYNELVIFLKANGKSSMDDLYIKEIKEGELPLSIKERREKRIRDFIYDDDRLIVFFGDNKTKVFIIRNSNELKYARNEKPFLSSFGEEIIFNSKIRYTYDLLYKEGKEINFSYQSLRDYVINNVYKLSDVTQSLGYSRQFINAQEKRGKIKTIKSGIYLKNDLIKNKWLVSNHFLL